MKKTLLALGFVAIAAAALGQGQINIECETTSSGVAVQQWDHTLAGGSGTAKGDWYRGTLTVELYYAPEGTTAASQVDAINAAEEAGGNASSSVPLADLSADTDFTLQTLAAPSNGTLGTGDTSAIISTLTFGGAGAFGVTVELPNIPANSTGDFILAGMATINGYTYEGLVGFDDQATGGSYTTNPPGTAADDQNAWDAAGINLDLAPVPEPTTLALAGLGGFCLLLFRRQRQ